MKLIPYSNTYSKCLNDVYGHKTTNKLINRGVYRYLSVLGLLRSNMYMCINNDDVIGWGCIIRKINVKSLKIETWIAAIYILESFRHQNLGTQMMQNIISECRSKNYNCLSLYVEKNNIGACKLYEKLGFIYEKCYKNRIYYKMTYIIQ